MILITQPDAKNVPNCDVSFANGELHQAWSRDVDDERVL